MSTKCSQLFLPQLGNRSSLNPSCFKEKQRPEWDFPRAKVAGILKSPIRVSAKNPKTAAVPCRTTRILKERGAFPCKSGAVFLSATASPTYRSQGSPRRKPAVFFKGSASPFGARSVLFGTARQNEFARIKILLKMVSALVGIRTPLFPGTSCERNLTIPQSKIRDFCQLPLHKGAVGCSRTSALFRTVPAQKNRVPKNRDAVEICTIQPISP